jgi:5-methylcytosine-specific restriction endonuclease McrA
MVANPERLYDSVRWRKRSKAQRRQHVLCERCLAKGKVVVAQVAHHRIPHNDDPELFWNGALESLCKPCHDSEATPAERRGYSTTIGVDGWPLCPDHPANRQSGRSS